MPGVFHNSPTQFVRQIRLGQPLPEPDIVTPRPLLDLPSRHAKLRATGCTHLVGNLGAREQLHEAGLKVFACMDVFAMGVGMWTDLGRASQDPRTAEVHVALLLEVLGSKTPEHGDAVVVGVVVVPLEALRVDEEHHVGEAVVVVDNVAEIVSRSELAGRLTVVDWLSGCLSSWPALTSNTPSTPSPC